MRPANHQPARERRAINIIRSPLRAVSAAPAALGLEHQATLTALHSTGGLITSDRNVISTIATHLHTAPATNRQIDALTRAYAQARLTSASCEATLLRPSD
jgi:hypothetical protein